MRLRKYSVKFDELDSKMRVFETNHDQCVLPGLYIVARIDGRSFTRLTRDRHHLKRRMTSVFGNLMLETT